MKVIQVCVLVAVAAMAGAECTPAGTRCDGEGAECCFCPDNTQPPCIVSNGPGMRDDYSNCECQVDDTCASIGGACVKNCGNGNSSNCESACISAGIIFVDNNQCNASTGGGWRCPGTDVCCHCSPASSVLPLQVTIVKSNNGNGKSS